MNEPFILCESSSYNFHASMEDFAGKFQIAKNLLSPVVNQIVNNEEKREEYNISKSQYHNAICATKLLQNIDDEMHITKRTTKIEDDRFFGNVNYSIFGNVVINQQIAKQLLEMYNIVTEILDNLNQNSNSTMEPISSLRSLLEEIRMSDDDSSRDHGDSEFRNEIIDVCDINSISDNFIDEISDVYHKTFMEDGLQVYSTAKSKQDVNVQPPDEDVNLLIKCGVDGSLTATAEDGRHLHVILNGNIIGSASQSELDKIKICMNRKRIDYKDVGFFTNKDLDSEVKAYLSTTSTNIPKEDYPDAFPLTKDKVKFSQVGSKMKITFTQPQDDAEKDSKSKLVQTGDASLVLPKDKVNISQEGNQFKIMFPLPDGDKCIADDNTEDLMSTCEVKGDCDDKMGLKITITFPEDGKGSILAKAEPPEKSSEDLRMFSKSKTTLSNVKGYIDPPKCNCPSNQSNINVIQPKINFSSQTITIEPETSTLPVTSKSNKSFTEITSKSSQINVEPKPSTIAEATKSNKSLTRMPSRSKVELVTNPEESKIDKSSSRSKSIDSGATFTIARRSKTDQSQSGLSSKLSGNKSNATVLGTANEGNHTNDEPFILRGKDCSQNHLFSTEEDSAETSKISVIFNFDNPAGSLVLRKPSVAGTSEEKPVASRVSVVGSKRDLSTQISETQRGSRTKIDSEFKIVPDAQTLSKTKVSESKTSILFFRPQVCASMKLNVEQLETNMRSKGIKHGNIEVTKELKKLGVDLILRACRPAVLCRKGVLNERQRKCLPYSPSIRSLPLSVDDIKIIQESFDRSLYNEKTKNKNVQQTLAYYTNLVQDDFYSAVNYPYVAPSYEVRYFFLPKNIINRASGSDDSARSNSRRTSKPSKAQKDRKYSNYVSQDSLNKLIQKLTTESNITYASLLSLMNNDRTRKTHQIVKNHDSLESLVNHIEPLDIGRDNEFLVMKTQFQNNMYKDSSRTCEVMKDADNFVSMPSGYKLVIIVKCTDEEDICEYLIRSKSKNIVFNCNDKQCQLQSCKLKLKGIPMCLDLNDVTQNQIGELLVGLKTQNPQDVIEIQIRHCEHCKNKIKGVHSKKSKHSDDHQNDNNPQVYCVIDERTDDTSSTSHYLNSYYLERAENFQTATPFNQSTNNSENKYKFEEQQEKTGEIKQKTNHNVKNDIKLEKLEVENLRFYMPIRNNEFVEHNQCNSKLNKREDININQLNSFDKTTNYQLPSTTNDPIKLELSMLSRSSKPCTKSARSSKAFHSFSYYTNLVKDDYKANNNFPWVIPTYEINYFFVTATFDETTSKNQHCGDKACGSTFECNSYKYCKSFKIKNIKQFLSKYLSLCNKKAFSTSSMKTHTSKEQQGTNLGKKEQQVASITIHETYNKKKPKKVLSLDSYTQTLLDTKKYVSVDTNSSLNDIFTVNQIPIINTPGNAKVNVLALPEPKATPIIALGFIEKITKSTTTDDIKSDSVKEKRSRKGMILSSSKPSCLVNIINLSKSISDSPTEEVIFENIEVVNKKIEQNSTTTNEVKDESIKYVNYKDNCSDTTSLNQQNRVTRLYIYKDLNESAANLSIDNDGSEMSLASSDSKTNNSYDFDEKENTSLNDSDEDIKTLMKIVNIFQNYNNKSPFASVGELRNKIGKMMNKQEVHIAINKPLTRDQSIEAIVSALISEKPSFVSDSSSLHEIVSAAVDLDAASIRQIENLLFNNHEYGAIDNCAACRQYLEQNGIFQRDGPDRTKRIYLPYHLAGKVNHLLENIAENGQIEAETLEKILRAIGRSKHNKSEESVISRGSSKDLRENSLDISSSAKNVRRVLISNKVQTQNISATYVNLAMQTCSKENTAFNPSNQYSTAAIYTYPVTNINFKVSKGLQKNVSSIAISMQTEPREDWTKLLHTDFSSNYVVSFLKQAHLVSKSTGSVSCVGSKSVACSTLYSDKSIQNLDHDLPYISNDVAKIKSLLHESSNDSTFKNAQVNSGTVYFDMPTKDNSSKDTDKEISESFNTVHKQSSEMEYDESYRNFWVLPTKKINDGGDSKHSEELLEKKDSFERFLDTCIKHDQSRYKMQKGKQQSNPSITDFSKCKSRSKENYKYAKERLKQLDYKTVYDTLQNFIMEPKYNDHMTPSKLVLNYFTNIIYNKVISDFNTLAQSCTQREQMDRQTKSNIVYYCRNSKIVNQKSKPERSFSKFGRTDKYGISNRSKWIFNDDLRKNEFCSESEPVGLSLNRGTNQTSLYSSTYDTYDTSYTKTNNTSLIQIECRNVMTPLNKVPMDFKIPCMKILGEIISSISNSSMFTVQSKSITRRCFSCNEVTRRKNYKDKSIFSSNTNVEKATSLMVKKSNDICKQNSSKYLCRLPNTEPFMLIMNESNKSASSSFTSRTNSVSKSVTVCKTQVLQTIDETTKTSRTSNYHLEGSFNTDKRKQYSKKSLKSIHFSSKSVYSSKSSKQEKSIKNFSEEFSYTQFNDSRIPSRNQISEIKQKPKVTTNKNDDIFQGLKTVYALTKINLAADGFKDLEVLDVSKISPRYYIKSKQSKVLLFGDDHKGRRT